MEVALNSIDLWNLKHYVSIYEICNKAAVVNVYYSGFIKLDSIVGSKFIEQHR